MLVYILNAFFFFFFFFFLLLSSTSHILLTHNIALLLTTITASHIIAQASIHYSNILLAIRPSVNLTTRSKMLLNKSLVFGLLSLLYTVDAIKSPSKPALAKRQDAFTATNGICTAVCKELASMGPSKATECDVYCSEDDEDDDDYSIITLSPTSTVTSTVTTTTKAVLKQRDMMTTEAPLNRRSIYSTVQGDCTVVCWDLMPGTECDLQCSSAVKTEMPGNVTHSCGSNSFYLLALVVQALILLNTHLIPILTSFANSCFR